MASSVYAPVMVDALDPTGTALDMVAAANKAALFTNALTPNFLTDSDFTLAPYTTNEVSSAGYTAGGLAIPTPTWVAAGAAPVITYDAGDLGWVGVTFTARRCIFYADGLATNNVFYCLDFLADFTATAGPFNIVFAGTGIFTWTL